VVAAAVHQFVTVYPSLPLATLAFCVAARVLELVMVEEVDVSVTLVCVSGLPVLLAVRLFTIVVSHFVDELFVVCSQFVEYLVVPLPLFIPYGCLLD
jgi:hypothetical protein